MVEHGCDMERYYGNDGGADGVAMFGMLIVLYGIGNLLELDQVMFIVLVVAYDNQCLTILNHC